MKKTFLVLTLLCISNFLSAQNCTPTWPTGGGAGIIPDSITNLPPAYEGSAYSATINFKVPKDTTASLGGFPVAVTINDITIDNVDGFAAIPSTVPFTYVSNPADGIFEGDSVGCILITGTPAPGSYGTYAISVAVTAHAVINLSGTPVDQPYTVDYYVINVNYPSNSDAPKLNEFTLMNAVPNPTSNITTINYFVPNQNNVELNVYSTIGQLLISKKLNSQAGINTYNLDLSDFSQGNYFYSLKCNDEKFIRSLTIVK